MGEKNICKNYQKIRTNQGKMRSFNKECLMETVNAFPSIFVNLYFSLSTSRDFLIIVVQGGSILLVQCFSYIVRSILCFSSPI